MKSKEERLVVINQLIKFISDRGRRFFYSHENEKVSEMKIIRNRIYYIDSRTDFAVYAYSSNREHIGFSHGGTLWALVCEFSKYIRTGESVNGYFGYGGLYSDGWGHSDEIQQEIIDYAKEIGYLK